MPSTARFPNEALPPVTHGLLATWWDATFAPSELAASVAKGEPRVAASAYFGVALAASCVLAALVNRIQLAYALHILGASPALPFLMRAKLAEVGAWMVVNVLALVAAALLFARLTKQPLRQVLRMRAYAAGPISYLYAWWAMYRWLREADPGARRAEAWALMGFTVEWGLPFVLAHWFAWPLRDLLLDLVPR